MRLVHVPSGHGVDSDVTVNNNDTTLPILIIFRSVPMSKISGIPCPINRQAYTHIERRVILHIRCRHQTHNTRSRHGLNPCEYPTYHLDRYRIRMLDWQFDPALSTMYTRKQRQQTLFAISGAGAASDILGEEKIRIVLEGLHGIDKASKTDYIGSVNSPLFRRPKCPIKFEDLQYSAMLNFCGASDYLLDRCRVVE